ncbi:MAG: rhomboid family intramembrane serine protease [Planctomycetota bacterium]
MKSSLSWIGILLLAIWLVRIVDAATPFYSLVQHGLQPRSLTGLQGVVLMPFLHGSFGHVLSNTISLAILLPLLIGLRKRPWMLVILTSLLGAGLLWLVGRSDNHIGASGLVFGLIGLLIVNGFLRRSLLGVAVAVLVGVLFGGTLLSGVMPGGEENVSWDGHLCGFLGGAAIAYFAGDDQKVELRESTSEDES